MAPSLLLLLLVSLVPVVMLAAAADGQGGKRCAPVGCGNLTISYPFGVVSEEATETNDCGSLGFQVLCDRRTPYLGLYSFQILDIFYDNGSLLVADVHTLRKDFNPSAADGCQAPGLNSSSKISSPFSISPVNQNLIFYNCTKPLTDGVRQNRGLVETICRNNTYVGVGGRYNDVSGRYGDYFLEGCKAIVAPALVRSGKANANNYLELISDGLLLTWQPLPPPPLPPFDQPPAAGKLTL
ncbi:unnamed protein product [Urochloa decumbens]|uniref:Wall-associated receptor kinase galacturonan-binding domain-containing protein n=1 Tax=Urochloa decumbens TaxID=240449 RepID=A0ABC9H467_9POAL